RQTDGPFPAGRPGGPNQGSEITGQASAALARATPEIDLYVAEPRGKWPRLLAAPGSEVGTEDPGAFPPLDMVELAAVADRYADFPPVASAEPRPRTYPEDLFPGLPLGLQRQPVLELEALRLGLRTWRYTRELFVAEDGSGRGSFGFLGPQASSVAVAAATIATHKGL